MIFADKSPSSVIYERVFNLFIDTAYIFIQGNEAVTPSEAVEHLNGAMCPSFGAMTEIEWAIRSIALKHCGINSAHHPSEDFLTLGQPSLRLFGFFNNREADSIVGKMLAPELPADIDAQIVYDLTDAGVLAELTYGGHNRSQILNPPF